MLKPIFHTGLYIVLDSGFCVLKSIVALKEKGFFAAAIIKKCRYWPTHIPKEHVLNFSGSRRLARLMRSLVSLTTSNTPFGVWRSQFTSWKSWLWVYCSAQLEGKKSSKCILWGRRNNNNNLPIHKAISMVLPLQSCCWWPQQSPSYHSKHWGDVATGP